MEKEVIDSVNTTSDMNKILEELFLYITDIIYKNTKINIYRMLYSSLSDDEKEAYLSDVFSNLIYLF